MLNILFGTIPDAEKNKKIYNTAVYFKNRYKDSWIMNDLSIEMIKDIDNSYVVSEKEI